ncbi:MAG: TldD/PmbA family protein [Bacillota bacterium]
MIEKSILERVLNRALDSEADFAEVFVEHTLQQSISLQDQKVDDIGTNELSGAGIRLAKGYQSVYGHTNHIDEKSLLELAENLRVAFEGERVLGEVSLKPAETKNDHAIKVSPKTVSTDRKVRLMKRADKAARLYSKDIKQVNVGYMDVVQNVQIASTEDIHVKDRRVRTRLAIHSVAQNEHDMQSGFNGPGAHQGFEFYDTIDVEEAARESARIAVTMLYADECPSKTMPVVVDNGFGGVIFHEACGHSLEATTVAKNASVFSGKKGVKIGSELVTAIDDGTIPNAWGSSNYDDEGRPQKKRVLIKEGVLTSYMVDHLNGLRMQEPSTHSGRRQSYKYAPTSRMSNTYIDNGDSTFDEIIENTDYGLYARKMGGGSVNPSTGEFNFAVMEGYMIRNGKIAEPVKSATLVGTGKDALKKIDMVGNNLERAQGMCGSASGSIPTDVGQPTIRISAITVGGRKGDA